MNEIKSMHSSYSEPEIMQQFYFNQNKENPGYVSHHGFFGEQYSNYSENQDLFSAKNVVECQMNKYELNKNNYESWLQKMDNFYKLYLKIEENYINKIKNPIIGDSKEIITTIGIGKKTIQVNKKNKTYLSIQKFEDFFKNINPQILDVNSKILEIKLLENILQNVIMKFEYSRYNPKDIIYNSYYIYMKIKKVFTCDKKYINIPIIFYTCFILKHHHKITSNNFQKCIMDLGLNYLKENEQLIIEEINGKYPDLKLYLNLNEDILKKIFIKILPFFGIYNIDDQNKYVKKHIDNIDVIFKNNLSIENQKTIKQLKKSIYKYYDEYNKEIASLLDKYFDEKTLNFEKEKKNKIKNRFFFELSIYFFMKEKNDRNSDISNIKQFKSFNHNFFEKIINYLGPKKDNATSLTGIPNVRIFPEIFKYILEIIQDKNNLESFVKENIITFLHFLLKKQEESMFILNPNSLNTVLQSNDSKVFVDILKTSEFNTNFISNFYNDIIKFIEIYFKEKIQKALKNLPKILETYMSLADLDIIFYKSKEIIDQEEIKIEIMEKEAIEEEIKEGITEELMDKLIKQELAKLAEESLEAKETLEEMLENSIQKILTESKPKEHDASSEK
jgi:hypothetical protein